jgi:N4-gp56 family major capsid protein
MPGQLWATNSVGGFLANTVLDQFLHYSAQPLVRFRQFTEVKKALGKHAGTTFNWDKIANVSTIGGSLIETNTMHKAEQTISTGSLTITEYGNSIPFTKKLDIVSEFDVKEMIRKGLLDDFRKVMDGLVEVEFNKTQLQYVGTTTTTYTLGTDGTATTSNSSAMNGYHVKNMVEELIKRNVPPYDGMNYICIASPEAMRGIFDYLETNVQQYTTQGQMKIYAGEVGRYYNTRFVLDNFATRNTYNAAARTATAKPWGNGLSMDAYIFGAGTVLEAVAQPETVIPKELTDYGRSKGLAWYFIGGFAIEWDTEADSRIIHWTTAG